MRKEGKRWAKNLNITRILDSAFAPTEKTDKNSHAVKREKFSTDIIITFFIIHLIRFYSNIIVKFYIIKCSTSFFLYKFFYLILIVNLYIDIKINLKIRI